MTQDSQEITNEPISVFQDLEELEKDKQLFFLWHKIRVARNTIGAMAVISCIIFTFLWATSYFDAVQLIVTIVFACCYFLSKKRPYPCLITALIVYAILFPLYVYTTYYNPLEDKFTMPGAGVMIGLVIRVVIIIYLVRGVIAAKKYEVLLKAN